MNAQVIVLKYDIKIYIKVALTHFCADTIFRERIVRACWSNAC